MIIITTIACMHCISSVTGGDDDRQSKPETAFSANEGTQRYTRSVIGVCIHR